MAQANVVTSAGNITWYTDKCQITALSGGVTYQVYATLLGTNPQVTTTIASGPTGQPPYELIVPRNYSIVINMVINGTNYTEGQYVTSIDNSTTPGYTRLGMSALSNSGFAPDNGPYTFTFYETPVGNIWSNPVAVGNNASVEIYVGAGNKLTVTGTFTAAELGTGSSAQDGVIGINN